MVQDRTRGSGLRRTDALALGLSAGLLALFLILGAMIPKPLAEAVKLSARKSADGFGLVWQILAFVSFVTGLVISGSKLGGLRLGGDKPDMSYGRWLATILCTLLAGGGVFWSAAEPMYHFISSPPTFSVADGTEAAAMAALAQSFFHWGFLAWSLTGTLGAIVLLRLAEKGLAIQPRTLVAPLFRGRTPETVGTMVDAASILAAAAGTIGPIGFLGLQLSYAGERFLAIPDGSLSKVLVVVALTLVATFSAVSGVEKGIQTISRLNVVLVMIAAILLITLGPARFIVRGFFVGSWLETSHLLSLAFHRKDTDWLSSWTVFYWGWFLGYGPIMSVFVARISRGRTVREILLSISILSPLLTAAWFAVLGGTGLERELAQPGIISGPLQADGLGAALFAILETVPASYIHIPLFIVLIFLFLVTSADSVAFGLAMVLSRSEEPPIKLRVMWCILMGSCAIFLLLATQDGVSALQSFIVVAAVPVSLVMATLPLTVFLVLNRGEADSA